VRDSLSLNYILLTDWLGQLRHNHPDSMSERGLHLPGKFVPLPVKLLSKYASRVLRSPDCVPGALMGLPGELPMLHSGRRIPGSLLPGQRDPARAALL
jgi:hypothetical protein